MRGKKELHSSALCFLQIATDTFSIYFFPALPKSFAGQKLPVCPDCSISPVPQSLYKIHFYTILSLNNVFFNKDERRTTGHRG